MNRCNIVIDYMRGPDKFYSLYLEEVHEWPNKPTYHYCSDKPESRIAIESFLRIFTGQTAEVEALMYIHHDNVLIRELAMDIILRGKKVINVKYVAT